MNWDVVQLVAGMVSSCIFATGTMAMLVKTLRTKDVSSFSMVTMVANNIGNGVNWVYILSLPFGPIHILHGFYTIAAMIMLVCCIVYRERVTYQQIDIRRQQEMQIVL